MADSSLSSSSGNKDFCYDFWMNGWNNTPLPSLPVGFSCDESSNSFVDTSSISSDSSYFPGYRDISAGGYTSFFIENSNSYIRSAGANEYGQIGDSSTADRSTPVVIAMAAPFAKVSAGSANVSALDIDGYAWCWGRNSFGQLGDKTTTGRSSPVSVVGGRKFTSISTGPHNPNSHVLALDENGYCWTWGKNEWGKMGIGYAAAASSPVSVIGGHQFVQVSAGVNHSAALDGGGTVWVWGYNGYGEAGCDWNSCGVQMDSPVSVVSGMSQVASGGDHIIALDINGYAWGWGYNNQGQVGNGSTYGAQNPTVTSVIGGHKFVKVAAGGNHSLAIDESGYAWAWGGGNGGMLGDNTGVDRSSPVSVVGGVRFTHIAGGDYHSLGIDVDGNVWSWGNGARGELGNNQTSHRYSPILVGRYISSLSSMSSVSSVSSISVSLSSESSSSNSVTPVPGYNFTGSSADGQYCQTANGYLSMNWETYQYYIVEGGDRYYYTYQDNPSIVMAWSEMDYMWMIMNVSTGAFITADWSGQGLTPPLGDWGYGGNNSETTCLL